MKKPTTRARAEFGADLYQAALDSGYPVGINRAAVAAHTAPRGVQILLEERGELRRCDVSRSRPRWREAVRRDAAVDLVRLYGVSVERAAWRFGLGVGDVLQRMAGGAS